MESSPNGNRRIKKKMLRPRQRRLNGCQTLPVYPPHSMQWKFTKTKNCNHPARLSLLPLCFVRQHCQVTRSLGCSVCAHSAKNASGRRKRVAASSGPICSQSQRSIACSLRQLLVIFFSNLPKPLSPMRQPPR